MRDIYDDLLDKLRENNLIEYFSENASLENVDSVALKKLLTFPSKIFLQDDNLCYKDSNDETVCCPVVDVNVSEAGYWLSNKIPPPSFDIMQGGNLRKAEEAEACYICVVVASILKDEVFLDELNKLIDSYDFTSMNSLDSDETFLNLLISWQDLQSVVINVIISSAKYAISDQKKESESFLRDGLTNEEQDALRDLALNIKSINFEYSTGSLSPNSVKTLTKIEILQLIDKRNQEIDSIVSKSKYGDLYKTLNLSSEYVNPITKKKIFNFCITEVEKMFNNDPSLSKDFGRVNDVVSKFRKRAMKLAVNSVIRSNVIRYQSDKENYILPRKV